MLWNTAVWNASIFGWVKTQRVWINFYHLWFYFVLRWLRRIIGKLCINCSIRNQNYLIHHTSKGFDRHFLLYFSCIYTFAHLYTLAAFALKAFTSITTRLYSMQIM